MEKASMGSLPICCLMKPIFYEVPKCSLFYSGVLKWIKLKRKREVLSVFQNTMRKLATTRSWDFLGMSEKLKRNAKAESNIIVGLLDTGIYVDAPSFSDEGYGPPPSKWKGKCDKGANFTGCNKKVVGAKFYNLGNMDSGMDPSPTDTDGHGSHTASTATGSTVSGGSLYGLAKGTVRGGVPGARIAMYKVCGTLGCSDMNLMAGFDDAIADGVDLLSVSIGGPAQSFFDDVIAIGSFHALKKGILTVCAAGNDGPEAGTVANVAPWILTVAATNLDREFRTKVKLGNGTKFTVSLPIIVTYHAEGTSVNTFTMKKAMYPLTSSDLAYNATSSPFANSSICEVDALSLSKVKGRIVLCMGNSAADWSIVRNNGSGTIIALDEVRDLASTALVPATIVNSNMGRKIAEYINSTKYAFSFHLLTYFTQMLPLVSLTYRDDASKWLQNKIA
ncbi:hypothetical protein Cgig2_024603 [Carnegiea gigantea]|uniref:Peptidase S8/S53 domain-containing protein n=1 Tax=Carnegiea gigantea TaxID=171969 RepID=A0A9Q1KJ97_9CARY|nr:hypothetical protein Cgig2_024603 [Carnegiea gigantea]